MAYKPDSIRKAVGRIAEQENRLENTPFLRNEIPREFIKRYLKPSDSALDAGGGAGVNAILMAGRCEKVTLIDISKDMLRYAEKNIHNAGATEKIEIAEGDITDLWQFADATFSFVVCVGGVLSIVNDGRYRALHELARVARKGAVLILGFDSKYGAIRHLLRYDDDLIDSAVEIINTNEWDSLESEDAKSHLYTVSEAAELIKISDCEILEVASTPTIINSLDERKYHHPAQWKKLVELEMQACTVSELLGIGAQLLFVARKPKIL